MYTKKSRYHALKLPHTVHEYTHNVHRYRKLSIEAAIWHRISADYYYYTIDELQQTLQEQRDIDICLLITLTYKYTDPVYIMHT